MTMRSGCLVLKQRNFQSKGLPQYVHWRRSGKEKWTALRLKTHKSCDRYPHELATGCNFSRRMISKLQRVDQSQGHLNHEGEDQSVKTCKLDVPPMEFVVRNIRTFNIASISSLPYPCRWTSSLI